MVTKEKSIWKSNIQVYNFFSVFLERKVIDISHLDLSFLPLDYIEQLIQSQHQTDGQGYLNLLMMLFTEYFQENATGSHKITLPESKYELISRQFILYCHCELFRRDHKIKNLKEENLFDPNLKTVFLIEANDFSFIPRERFSQLNILIKNFSIKK